MLLFMLMLMLMLMLMIATPDEVGPAILIV
jgi:hypothetical protein